jgi:hypothetical protein
MALDMRCKTECVEREEIILSESHLGKCYTYLSGLIKCWQRIQRT